MDPTVLDFKSVPGLSIVEGIGVALLWVALFWSLIQQFYRFTLTGSADFITPLVKVVFGFVVLHHVPAIVEAAATMSQSAAEQMTSEVNTALFEEAYSHASGGLSSLDHLGFDNAIAFLNPKAWIALGAASLYLAMAILKILLIDLLWPLTMSLLVPLGYIAVPLGLFPGGRSHRGWFASVIEVALWPLIFRILTGMMVGAFGDLLQSVRDLDVLKLFIEGATNEGLWVFLRWTALCLAYVLVTLSTPRLARMAVQSELGGRAGDMVAGLSHSAMARTTRVAMFAMTKFTGAPVALAAAQHVAKQGAAATKTAGAAKSVDARTYPTPRPTGRPAPAKKPPPHRTT